MFLSYLAGNGVYSLHTHMKHRQKSEFIVIKPHAVPSCTSGNKPTKYCKPDATASSFLFH